MIGFLTLGVLGVLGANPFRAGEYTRAKDAKVKGMNTLTDDLSLYSVPLFAYPGEQFGNDEGHGMRRDGG